MSYNGSGVFNLYTPGNPVVTGTTISSTWANNTLTDIATGLSTAITKNGQTTITANLPMAGFIFTGLGAGTAAGHSVRYEQVFPAQRMLISGLTYANNGSDATNDIDFAVGGAMDATGVYYMALSSALTKQSDAAWAVGTNAGMLDTGAVGNSDYYVWLIARSDTGVVDILSSLSSTAPTMPANYSYKRLIGWFKRVGGTIVAFTTYETEGGGIELLWTVPTLDVNLANTLTTSRRTDAVKVPLNFSVEAHLNVYLFDGSSGYSVWICCPDQTDAAPSNSSAPLMNFGAANTSIASVGALKVRTSAAGLIAARSDFATVDAYRVSTMGFEWARRN